ncbi:MAG: hypothetical protein WC350_06005 [Candidatus Micrarchaeia archaeon]
MASLENMTEKQLEEFNMFSEHFKNSQLYKVKGKDEVVMSNKDHTVSLSKVPCDVPSFRDGSPPVEASISKEIFAEIKPFLPRVVRLVKYHNEPFNFELECGLWLSVAPFVGVVFPRGD